MTVKPIFYSSKGCNMDKIHDKLYVGSLEAANDEELLRKHNIGFVISLGCEMDESHTISRIAFPNILDTPETLIMDIFRLTNAILQFNYENGINTLVHCRYGQSRSVSVICSYLMSISLKEKHKKTNIVDIMDDIKKIRNICINPSFLCQLYHISHNGGISKSLLNMMAYINKKSLPKIIIDNNTYNKLDDDDIPWKKNLTELLSTSYDSETNATYKLLCKKCKTLLAYSPNDIIVDDLDYKTFVKDNVDDFWKGYIPLNQCKQYKPNFESILIAPQSKIIQDISAKNAFTDSGDICCSKCSHKIGEYRHGDLSVCGNYINNVSFRLNKKEIAQKRLLHA